MNFPTYYAPPQYGSIHWQNHSQPMNPMISGDGQVRHIQCEDCSTRLRFVGNAAAVRCARCGHISRIPLTERYRPPLPPSQPSALAQLVCSNINCGILLSYPAGASQVQCSMCRVITAANRPETVAQIVCRGCQAVLRHAAGAASVRCSVCRHITPTTAINRARAYQQHQRPSALTVVVENPAGDLAIGVSLG